MINSKFKTEMLIMIMVQIITTVELKSNKRV